MVVVNQQPTRSAVVVAGPRAPDYMGLSVFMLIFCLICGSPLALICTIPAVVFANMAKEDNANGDVESARRHARIALFLNLGTVGYAVIAYVVIIIVVAVNTASANSSYNNNYN